MAIDVKELSFSYPGSLLMPSGRERVLENVNLSVGKGELVALLGANGAGKTTLFKCILRLLEGFSGTVTVDGEDASSLGTAALAGHIAYIPQRSFPVFGYSVISMVMMGTAPGMSLFSSPGKKEREQACDALEHLGIGMLSQRSFTSLSGGEQQLVLFARALVQKAGTWILDEPMASLDTGNRLMVFERLKKLASEGYSILVSTHSPEQAYMFADRMAAIKDGRIVKDGSPQEVMTTEVMNMLYGCGVRVESFDNDSVRLLVPGKVL